MFLGGGEETFGAGPPPGMVLHVLGGVRPPPQDGAACPWGGQTPPQDDAACPWGGQFMGFLRCFEGRYKGILRRFWAVPQAAPPATHALTTCIAADAGSPWPRGPRAPPCCRHVSIHHSITPRVASATAVPSNAVHNARRSSHLRCADRSPDPRSTAKAARCSIRHVSVDLRSLRPATLAARSRSSSSRS